MYIKKTDPMFNWQTCKSSPNMYSSRFYTNLPCCKISI